MTSDFFNRWTIGGGFIYWSYDCSNDVEFKWDGHLRRKPAHGTGGTSSTTLELIPFTSCHHDKALAADADGTYYYDNGPQRFEMRAAGTPTIETPVYTTTNAPEDSIGLATDATYVYWIYGTQLRRAPKDGTSTGAGLVATTNSGPTSLVVYGNYAYWLDSTGLWSVDKSCTTLPCGTKSQLSTTSGKYLLYQYHSTTIFSAQYLWWANGDKIQYYYCNIIIIGGCNTGTFYTALATWKIGKLGSDGSNMFWIENYDDCSPFCLPSVNGKLQRKALTSGTAQPIAENITNYGESLFADSSYVYYYNYIYPTAGVMRLPVDATAISHDLAADKWEVVQAVQSPSNDVPLVANKPTYVRAYGKQLSGSSRANTAEAYLYGSRGGSPLPGSPLKSINGTRSFNTGGTYDRGNLNDGWLFQLPGSWTNPATINLQLTVDPRQIYYDPSRANNSLSSSFVFNHKAPACIVTVPVRTNGPSASPSGSHFWFSIDMIKRLWPAGDVWVYKQDSPVEELEACWWGPFPYPCYGDYELPDDGWKVLLSLGTRDLFSDDPDECDAAGAVTHYVGIVHPNANTGTANGAGYMSMDQAWVKLPPLNPDTNNWQTTRAATMAHEMSHNYGRKHVNCGGPDDVDSSYPYPPCQLDNTGPNAHYGFQSTNKQVIAPDAAIDFMAYGTNRWVSDYNWKSMLGKISSLAAEPAQAQGIVQPNLAAASSVVMLSGAITPTTNQGVLGYAWVVPTGALSSRVLAKWQAIAAPALDVSLMQPSSPLTPTYHVKLYDNNNVMLDDRVVSLDEYNTHPENPTSPSELASVFTFAAAFPAPAGTVARLDLLADSTLLAQLQPGLSLPAVNILQPAGGETFNNQMTILFNASDANANDRLLFQVQYSPDGGLTWRPVTDNWPANPDTQRVTLTLNSLAGFPGSAPNQGRIRVLASDGYHTTVATSNGFTMNNHPPEAYILSPDPARQEEAGKAITLRGGATDAEDGGLGDASLQWKINGTDVSTGTEVIVAGLAPGTYTVTLTAQDSLAQKQTVTTTMNIGILAIPLSSSPTLDGFCDDPAYANATQLQLSPYAADGGQATARLIRTSTDLWVCLSGMNQKSGTSPYGLAGIGVDVNNSGGVSAQATDYRFWVKEDGTPVTDQGNGAGAYVAGGPTGLQTMISADGTFWNAELRIPADALGGWQHLVRLNVFHEWARFVGDQNRWPYASTYNGPSTWALTLLGDWQKIYLPIVMR